MSNDQLRTCLGPKWGHKSYDPILGDESQSKLQDDDKLVLGHIVGESDVLSCEQIILSCIVGQQTYRASTTRWYIYGQGKPS